MQLAPVHWGEPAAALRLSAKGFSAAPARTRLGHSRPDKRLDGEFDSTAHIRRRETSLNGPFSVFGKATSLDVRAIAARLTRTGFFPQSACVVVVEIVFEDAVCVGETVARARAPTSSKASTSFLCQNQINSFPLEREREETREKGVGSGCCSKNVVFSWR